MDLLLSFAAGAALAGVLLAWLLTARVREARAQGRLELEPELATLSERLRARDDELARLREQFAEKLAALEETRLSFADAFKALSADALSRNNQSFLELARATLEKYQEGAKGELEKRQQAIGELVAPVKITLEKFEQQIQTAAKGARLNVP